MVENITWQDPVVISGSCSIAFSVSLLVRPRCITDGTVRVCPSLRPSAPAFLYLCVFVCLVVGLFIRVRLFRGGRRRHRLVCTDADFVSRLVAGVSFSPRRSVLLVILHLTAWHGHYFPPPPTTAVRPVHLLSVRACRCHAGYRLSTLEHKYIIIPTTRNCNRLTHTGNDINPCHDESAAEMSRFPSASL